MTARRKPKISPPDGDERTVSSKVVYKGKKILVRRDTVLLPSGKRTFRENVVHPGSVGIIPILDDGRILMVRQFRAAAAKRMWEIPAGTLEEGETPEECARRELKEETGYRAEEFRHIFDCYLTPGYSTELMRVFIATSMVEGEQSPDEDEFITVERMKPQAALSRLLEETTDAKTIAAIGYLLTAGKKYLNNDGGT